MSRKSYETRSLSSSRRIFHYDDMLEVPTCKCGKEMKFLASWTDANPRRRHWYCDGKGMRKRWDCATEPTISFLARLIQKLNKKDEEIDQLKTKIREVER